MFYSQALRVVLSGISEGQTEPNFKNLLFIIFKSGGMRNRIVSGEEEDFSSQEIRNGSSRD